MKAVLATAWAGTSPLEIVGVILGLVYVALAIRENRACWVAALLSTLAYLWVFYQAGLYMQAFLQVYYVMIALYGWRAWTTHPEKPALLVSRSPWMHHCFGLLFIGIGSADARLFDDLGECVCHLVDGAQKNRQLAVVAGRRFFDFAAVLAASVVCIRGVVQRLPGACADRMAQLGS